MPANPQTSTDFFGAQAARWLRLYQSNPSFEDRLGLFSTSLIAALPSRGRVLDFGCGPGVMSLALAEQGYDVLGVDGADAMIETAKHEQRRRGVSNCEFRVMDAADVSLDAESFDAIVCSSVIEYVENDVGLVRALIGSLKPGGHLLVSVPHTASVIGKIEDALRNTVLFAQRLGGQHLGFSQRRYERTALLWLLGSMGLGSFECTSFEVPVLGRAGVALSRFTRIGVMLLVVGRKGAVAMPTAPVNVRDVPRSRLSPRAVSRKNIWASMPRVLRVGLGRPLSLLPPRLLFGKRFLELLKFVDNAQWWSGDEANAYQLRQLRRICEVAYARSPYYRRTFKEMSFEPRDLETTEDLRHLPTIDRNLLRDHREEMRTTSATARHVDFVSTGGTGGEPLHFYIGADRSAVEYAHLVNSWRRIGYDLFVPMAVLRGHIVRADRRGVLHEYDPVFRHHFYSSFHLTDDDMRKYVRHIRGLGDCFLHVYPSTVAMLARFIRRDGQDPLTNVRGIIAESEIVYPDQRKMVEDVFACKYLSCYGHSEKVVAAAGCEHSPDYHVWPTYGYFELLDERDQPVTEPGRRGEIVGTGFINDVIPFIRYRTGDFATFVADRCGLCGRRHPVIRDIEGHRTQEFLIARDGTLIPWAALNMHDDTFVRVRQFQFVQTVPGDATLHVVPGAGFNDNDVTAIRRALGAKMDGMIEFNIKTCDAIRLTPDGKSIYVDQRIEGVDQRFGWTENRRTANACRPLRQDVPAG